MVVHARDTSTKWGWKRMRVPPGQPARHSEIPSQNQNQNQSKDWRCRPVGEHLPSTCTGQGLLPSTARLPRQRTEEGQLEQQQDRQRHVAREAIHFYILQFFGSARREHQLSLLKALAWKLCCLGAADTTQNKPSQQHRASATRLGIFFTKQEWQVNFVSSCSMCVKSLIWITDQ